MGLSGYEAIKILVIYEAKSVTKANITIGAYRGAVPLFISSPITFSLEGDTYFGKRYTCNKAENESTNWKMTPHIGKVKKQCESNRSEKRSKTGMMVDIN